MNTDEYNSKLSELNLLLEKAKYKHRAYVGFYKRGESLEMYLLEQAMKSFQDEIADLEMQKEFGLIELEDLADEAEMNNSILEESSNADLIDYIKSRKEYDSFFISQVKIEIETRINLKQFSLLERANLPFGWQKL
jgi:hypothetical protein